MGIRSLSLASISTGVKRSKFWDQIATLKGPSFESIATVGLSGTASILTFNDIPQNYKHLEIRGYHFFNSAGNNWDSNMYMTINSDTNNANYFRGHVGSINSTLPSQSYGSDRRVLRGGGWENNAYYPAQSIIRIYDYASSSKYKSSLIYNGVDNTGTGGYTYVQIHTYKSNTPITTISFESDYTYTWNSDSVFALYGIKG